MADYDTAAIRAAARKLDNIANSVNSIRSKDIKAVQSTVKSLKGDSVSALDEAADELGSELNSMRKGLESCADALYDFARRLDEADARAKAMMNQQ